MYLMAIELPIAEANLAHVFYKDPGWPINAVSVTRAGARILQYPPVGFGYADLTGPNLTLAASGSSQFIHLIGDGLIRSNVNLVTAQSLISEVLHGEDVDYSRSDPAIRRMDLICCT